MGYHIMEEEWVNSGPKPLIHWTGGLLPRYMFSWWLNTTTDPKYASSTINAPNKHPECIIPKYLLKKELCKLNWPFIMCCQLHTPRWPTSKITNLTRARSFEMKIMMMDRRINETSNWVMLSIQALTVALYWHWHMELGNLHINSSLHLGQGFCLRLDHKPEIATLSSVNS